MMGAIGVIMPAQFTGSFNMNTPHCTLIYLGEYGAVNFRRLTLEIAVNRLRSQVVPQMVPTTGLDVFGHDTHTVIRLKSEVLSSWRDFIEKELRREGIISASPWAFAPHVTINKHEPSKFPVLPWPEFRVPATVWLDRPKLMWNETV